MEQVVQFITDRIRKHGLESDYTADIKALIESGRIDSKMSNNTAYTTLLIHQSKKHPVFASMLKNRYLFDISFTVKRTEELIAADENAGDGNESTDERADDAVAGSSAAKKEPGKTNSKTGVESKKTDGSAADQKEQERERRIEDSLKTVLKGRFEYIFVESRGADIFVGVKLNGSAFESVVNMSAPPSLIPYRLLARAFKNASSIRFCERLFDCPSMDGAEQKFAEFVEHIKDLRMPLSISTYDLLHGSTSIVPVYDAYVCHCASNQWPKDPEAVECVKAAFYCQIYSKSQYRAVINKKYAAFKYKDCIFKLQILREEDMSIRHHMLMRVQSIIKELGEVFSRKVRLAKMILGRLGFYPLIIDDFLAECIALHVGRGVMGDARFVESFLAFDFDLAGKLLSLDSLKMRGGYGDEAGRKQLKVGSGERTCNYSLPREDLLSELRERLQSIASGPMPMFNTSWELTTAGLLEPVLAGATFALSVEPRDGFEEIVGSFSSDLPLGTPSTAEFIGKSMHKEATFYYDPLAELMMVRVNGGYDVDFVVNVIITNTSFNYIKYN